MPRLLPAIYDPSPVDPPLNGQFAVHHAATRTCSPAHFPTTEVMERCAACGRQLNDRTRAATLVQTPLQDRFVWTCRNDRCRNAAQEHAEAVQEAHDTPKQG
jgi:hypothetical protein